MWCAYLVFFWWELWSHGNSLLNASSTLLPVLFILSNYKNMVKCIWWCFCYAGGAVFDASQYAFFGKDAVQEVELGGLEEDAHLPTFESNEEEFFLNREQVHFQFYVCFLSLKIHVARMFLSNISPLFLSHAIHIYGTWVLYQLTFTLTLQDEDVRSLSDIDDLTTTFWKVRMLYYDYHTFLYSGGFY